MRFPKLVGIVMVIVALATSEASRAEKKYIRDGDKIEKAKKTTGVDVGKYRCKGYEMTRLYWRFTGKSEYSGKMRVVGYKVMYAINDCWAKRIHCVDGDDRV